jgi:predicted GNAT family N-acyltransferase
MRYAESHKILGSILIGACYTDLGYDAEKQSHYYDKPWQWDKIRDNQKWIVQFASTDDPYIPIDEPRHVHRSLGTEYHEYTDRGHFGWDVKRTEFIEIVDVLKMKLEVTKSKMQTFTIEFPRVGDELAIGPMHVRSWKESYVGPESGLTEKAVDDMVGYLATDTEYRKNTIIEALENPDKTLYRVVKNDDGKIVGFLHCSKSGTSNILEGIYILDEAKGKGIGGSLMKEFLTWSDETKPSYLDVFSFNKEAFGFYSKYGFVKTDKPTRFFKDKLPYVEMVRPAGNKG